VFPKGGEQRAKAVTKFKRTLLNPNRLKAVRVFCFTAKSLCFKGFNGVALIGDGAWTKPFPRFPMGIDQLAPTVFFPSSGKEELGAKAAQDFHHWETRAAFRSGLRFFLLSGASSEFEEI